MIWIQHSVSILLVTAGLYFMLMGGIGLVRLPDFYSRSHAASMADTAGIILLLAGLAVFEGFSLVSAKLLIGLAFVGLANPVGIHALARVAVRFGVKPWTRPAPGNDGGRNETSTGVPRAG